MTHNRYHQDFYLYFYDYTLYDNDNEFTVLYIVEQNLDLKKRPSHNYV